MERRLSMAKKKIESRHSKISIMVEDKDSPPRAELNENGTPTGRLFKKGRWIEVKEINLGSIRKPNKDVWEFKVEPIKIEKEEQDKPRDVLDFFKKFGGI
jgi:hypothetical protein